MKNTTFAGSLLASVLLIAGCATASTSSSSGSASAPASVSEAIAQAKAAQQKAASVNGEWRDTGKLIKGAEKAAAAGDNDTAMKLAGEATMQGELGYKQAMEEKTAGNPSYLK